MGRRLRAGLVLASFGVVAAALPADGRPASIERLPDEVALTEVEQAEVLRGSDWPERTRLTELFTAPDRYLPVAYTRALYAITESDDGATVSEVGATEPRSGSHLSLPTRTLDAPSGTGGRYDLYQSVAIARLSGSPYRWLMVNYFRWNGSTGIDACNVSEDSLASAWADGLTLQSDSSYGYYRPWSGRSDPLDIYRSDAAPNIGVGWSFHELKQRGSQLCTNVSWGEGDAYLTEPSWQNMTANVVSKYVHTKGSGTYSLGFYVTGGLSPVITVNPADSNQWSTAAFAEFSH